MHNLEIRNGRASMVYVGETPWHRLGTAIAADAITAEEVLNHARMNFTVEKLPAFVMLKPAGLDHEVPVRIPDGYATVRTDTGMPLGQVGPSYSVMQNAAAFEFFDAVVGKGEAIYHTAGVLGRGERIWLLAKLPAECYAAGDAYRGYVLLTNAHDGTGSAVSKFVMERAVCQNTLNIALGEKGRAVRIRHTGDVEAKLRAAHEVMGLVARELQHSTAVIEALAREAMSADQMMNAARITLGVQAGEKPSGIAQATADRVIELARTGAGNSGRTAADFVQAFADFIDHERKPAQRAAQRTAADVSAVFGTGWERKADSVRAAAAVVGLDLRSVAGMN